ncbi:glycosyltransferase family 32 protein [Synechococcus sp. KORDI-100]|uniref:glycosyltransferase family 32 protein n=1 Tax=Synechococcus sp. KORDI-100 TaxID=1280380 RepID=UPI00194E3296|nr:hypothetical protein [Synechococcus sp. KORDI-100]
MHQNHNFFQIFLSAESSSTITLPDLIEAVSTESRSHLQGFHYRRWDIISLRNLLSSHFGRDVLLAFDSLRPFAYKADLGRYCLLYQFGGWYSDITLKIISSTLASAGPNSGLCFFRDYGEGLPSPHASSFDCQNSLIYSPAGHPVMLKCIEKILEHVRKKYYGTSSTAPTGPSLLGSILAGFGVDNIKQLGFFLPLTQRFLNRNLAYVSSSGEILAWHKTAWHPMRPRGGDMASLGLQGTNNYNQLWRERAVYV